MFLVVLLYMLFASSFTFGKAAVEIAQPIFIVGFRMTLAGFLLLIFNFINQKKIILPKKKHLKKIILVIFFHIYIAYILEFIVLQHITSSKTCLIYSSAPFITALLSYFIFNEKLSIRKWIGLIIGFFGLLPIIYSSNQKETIQFSFYFLSLYEILLLFSAIASATGWILIKNLVTKDGYSPIFINGITMFCGGFMALLTSFYFEDSPKIYLTNDTYKILLYIFLLILIANIICFNLYSYLLKKFSATFLSFAGFICPLFAAFLGYFFLNEQISKYFIISLSIVFIGLYIFYKEEKI